MNDKFQIIITETDTGITLKLVDYEKREKCEMPVDIPAKGLSVAWMADYMIKKCKETMRMNPEERKKKAEELNDLF